MNLRSAIAAGERDRLMRPSPEWAVEGVPAEHLASVWRRCWELLEPAATRFRLKEPWKEEAIIADLKAGKMQLWVAWSYARGRVEAALITRIHVDPPQIPAGKVMELTLCGGVNFAGWGRPIFNLTKAWAESHECSHILTGGRRGWKRLFGFDEVGTSEDGLPIFLMPLVRRH